MKKVRNLKKRTGYILGLVFALVFSYAFKESSPDQSGGKTFNKVPQAQADIPAPRPPMGTTNQRDDGGGGGNG